MTIRYAMENDIEQLIGLCSIHAEYEKAPYDPKDKWALLHEALFGSNYVLNCLVVQYDQKLVGYATFMKQYSTWDSRFYVYLDCLYLTPETRGLGIGRKIMNQISDYAQQENCKEIQWQTPDFNVGAIKFYERLGAMSKNKRRFFWNV